MPLQGIQADKRRLARFADILLLASVEQLMALEVVTSCKACNAEPKLVSHLAQQVAIEGVSLTFATSATPERLGSFV